jgi:hypothetical protein
MLNWYLKWCIYHATVLKYHLKILAVPTKILYQKLVLFVVKCFRFPSLNHFSKPLALGSRVEIHPFFPSFTPFPLSSSSRRLSSRLPRRPPPPASAATAASAAALLVSGVEASGSPPPFDRSRANSSSALAPVASTAQPGVPLRPASAVPTPPPLRLRLDRHHRRPASRPESSSR